MPAGLSATVDTNVSNYLRQFAEGLDSVINFATQQAKLYLRNEALPEAVSVIATQAGPGFPRAYRNHLMLHIMRLPLNVIHLGEGIVEVSFDLAPLGGWGELMLGAHHRAMLAENDDGDFKSFRITTKSQIRRVELPYNGDELLNSPERRLQWWNDAIIHRQFYTRVGKNWNWTKRELQTNENAWEAEEVPTFEQVASARINEAWEPFGLAPEWVLLEDGTPAGAGEPYIYPQNFSFRLQVMMDCVCREAITQSVVAFERLLAERQVIGIKGPQASPYNVLGQFVEYKDLLATSVPNLSNCLALL